MGALELLLFTTVYEFEHFLVACGLLLAGGSVFLIWGLALMVLRKLYFG